MEVELSHRLREGVSKDDGKLARAGRQKSVLRRIVRRAAPFCCELWLLNTRDVRKVGVLLVLNTWERRRVEWRGC